MICGVVVLIVLLCGDVRTHKISAYYSSICEQMSSGGVGGHTMFSGGRWLFVLSFLMVVGGNDGSYATVGSPATAKNILAVGATVNAGGHFPPGDLGRKSKSPFRNSMVAEKLSRGLNFFYIVEK